MANKFYGSASDRTSLVVDLYGGVNNQAQRITKLYGSAKTLHTSFSNTENVQVDESIFRQKLIDSGTTNFNGQLIIMKNDIQSSVNTIRVSCTGGPTITISNTSLTPAGAAGVLSGWGVSTTSTYISSLPLGTSVLTEFSTTENMETKLIHQGFGHLTYN